MPDLSGWSPAVRDALTQMLEAVVVSTPAPIAAFDFDDTCIHGDISHTLLEDLDRAGPGTLMRDYLAECEVDRYTAYTRLVGTLVAGRSRDEVEQLTAAALARGLRDGHIALRPEVRALMVAMRARGWEVWVVTASPTQMVQHVASRYGVPPHRVLGMNAVVDSTGRYTHAVAEPVTIGPGKCRALLLATGREPTFAAGDSISDAALLGSARYALLMNRGNDDLLAHARQRGWMVEDAPR